MKDIHFNIKAISGIASAFCLASCNWLDVSPEKVASFDDAMKNKQTTENWIYSCYGPIAETSPITYRTGSADGGIEYSTDEFVLPQTYGVGAQTLSYDQVTSSSEVSNFYWTRIYGAIGHINLFLRELDRHSPLGVTDDDRALYKAHTNFLKAYYYSLGLKLFGPVPIVNEYIDANTPAEEFPGRYHYDYVVNEIIRLLDEAVAFCRERGLEFYAVNRDYPEEEEGRNNHYSRKLKVDLFIDDRNLGGLPDWGTIYDMVHNRLTYETLLERESSDETPKKKGFLSKLFK